MIGTIRNNNNNPQSNFDSFSIKQTDQEQLRVFTYQVSAPQVVYITYTTAVSGFADICTRAPQATPSELGCIYQQIPHSHGISIT